MNILAVNNYGYIRGGSDRYFFDLCEMLTSHGHKVTSMAAGEEIGKYVAKHISVSPKNLSTPGFKDVIKFFYDRDVKAKLSAYVENNYIDVAHLNIYYGQITPSILQVLKEHNIPIVQTLHDYKIVCPTSLMYCNGSICEECSRNKLNAIKNKCNRNSLRRSLVSTVEGYISELMGSMSKVDQFITVSNFQRKKLIKHGIPEEKLTTIHNFTHFTHLDGGAKPGEYFLYYGRIEKIKGLHTLLRAAEQVPDISIVIVGKGEFEAELNKIIKRKRLDNIVVKGFANKEKLKKLILNSIATITPSEVYETFGLANIETMALGKPVISSAIGGMKEVVDGGKDGLLFEAGNVNELVNKIKWMALNREKVQAMGERGKQKVEKHFSKEEHYQQIINLYNKLI